MVKLQVFCFKFELVRCTIPAFQRVLFDFPGQEVKERVRQMTLSGGIQSIWEGEWQRGREGEEEYDWDEGQEDGNDNGVNDYENYEDFL